MYCPKCGTNDQLAESYCRHCGEWLPDLNALARRKLFGKLTREQKIEKIRILEAVSAGLSLTAAAIILSILAGGDRQMLFLAALCCVLVAVYQAINFYLGYKLQQRIKHSSTESTNDGIDSREVIAETRVNALGASNPDQFIGPQGVTENTTELLDPVPQRVPQKEINE